MMIKKILLGAMLIWFGFPFSAFAQKESVSDLTDEQYSVINTLYSGERGDTITVFYQTTDFFSWKKLLVPTEGDDPLAENHHTCHFVGDGFLDAVKQLKEMSVTEISVKNFRPENLNPHIKLTNDLSPPTHIVSEPFIFGDIAFLFVKLRYSEIISVYKKSAEGQWESQCYIDIYTIYI